MVPELQIRSTTKAPTLGANVGGGYPPDASWSNPTNIYTDNGTSASIGFFEGGQSGDLLVFTDFDYAIPDDAIIDGVEIYVDGSNTGCYGEIYLQTDTDTGTGADVGALNQTYGAPDDLWGLTLTPADVNHVNFGGNIWLNDVSGGDGIASVDYIEITVYWHYNFDVAPADVPKRYLYKVFRDSIYLGNLPNVTSKFGYSQDINSVGSSISVECGTSIDIAPLESDRIVTEAGDPIITEDDQYIYTEKQSTNFALGDSDAPALFQNGNRVLVYEYSYYYPNGKLMFSGSINRLDADIGSTNKVTVLILSDGLDLDNYIARGSPFSYTSDVSQTASTNYVTVTQDSKGAGWNRYGQSWRTGASVTNIGQIRVRLQGTATVTIYVYDNVNGNLISQVSKSVNAASATNVDFALPILADANSSDEYFFAIGVNAGQSIRVYRSTSNPYSGGQMYNSSYSGGSGGGSYSAVSGSDLYFVTYYGTPTTTATYTSKDPSTGMLVPIVDDYNLRGGLVTTTDDSIDATGLSLTYTFNTNTVLEAINKARELSPEDYYYYVDLGTSVLNFKQFSSSEVDFVLIKGRHIDSVKFSLSIENVKNYLLFSGGETGGVNLYREYQDDESIGNYGVRLDRKSDNRVTVAATANVWGSSYLDENSSEQYHTTVTIPDRTMDITLIKPGMIVTFAGFGTFLDNLVLRVVRLQYSPDKVELSLGILPKRIMDELEKNRRGLLAEQTIANPSAPS